MLSWASHTTSLITVFAARSCFSGIPNDSTAPNKSPAKASALFVHHDARDLDAVVACHATRMTCRRRHRIDARRSSSC
jgi:hypothetical protein